MDVESLESQFSSLSKVEFIDIRDQYSYNEDLTCRYSTGSYVAVEGDRIAIYKSGWMYVKDYFLFEWVPVSENYVTFNNISLPKDDKEFFQFCYISADNEVLGASKTFQFTNKISDYTMSANTNQEIVFSISNNPNSSGYNHELQKLREENEILKETVKLLIARQAPRNYDRDINELKGLIYGLKDMVNKQAGETNLLKNQVKVCIECNQNLIEEKSVLEKKYGESKMQVSSEIKSFHEFDIGELESIPPFPFAK